MMKNVLLLLSFLLLACDPEVSTPSACEVRAFAVCDMYAECYPELTDPNCIETQVGWCETAGIGKPDMERADACATALEGNSCEQPQECNLR